MTNNYSSSFQPKLLGMRFLFEDEEGTAMITDETEDEIFIEANHFVGWWPKSVFWERWGVEEDE